MIVVLPHSLRRSVGFAYMPQGSVFTITNAAKTPLPSTGDSDGTTLPQTGQLWVPVFVMATAGVALVLAGVLVRGKERSKERSGEHS